MNWNAIAIIVTVGLAQCGLVVTLVDRLFKAEMRTLGVIIGALKNEIAGLVQTNSNRDSAITNLQRRVQTMEDCMQMNGCMRGPCRDLSPERTDR